VVRDYGVRDNQLWVRGEVQVTVPMDVYYEHMARHKRNSGRFIGGVDVNTDRINLAIIDSIGRLIDHKTFWFSEASRKGFPKHIGGVDVNTDRINLAIIDSTGRLIDHRTLWFSEATARGFPKHNAGIIGIESTWRLSTALVDSLTTGLFGSVRSTARGFSKHKAWGIIGMRIHEMLNYAYHHGVKVLFLENPEVLGRLRLMWIRNGDRKHENYNYKVSVFRSTIIERIAMKAPLYSIEAKYVNPRGTTNSKEHDELMRKHGLDRHTASAYLTALKGLKHQQK